MAWGATVGGVRYAPVAFTVPAASRLPCSARVWRGPHELALLKQHVALIRQTLRASAAQRRHPSRTAHHPPPWTSRAGIAPSPCGRGLG